MTAQTTERQKNEMFSVVEIAGVSGGSKLQLLLKKVLIIAMSILLTEGISEIH